MARPVIAVPYHLGHEGVSVGAGPDALLAAGLAGERLRRPEPFRHEVGACFALNRALAARVREIAAAGPGPLVLAGNCYAAQAVIAGLSPAPLAIVWLDAHADFNTPDTTPTGFFDGAALSMCVGDAWRALCASVPGFEPVPGERVLLAGARCLDPEERARLDASPVRHLPPARIGGLKAALDELAAAGARDAYLHVDLDVLDPSEGRANEFAEPRGLSRDQVEQAIAAVRERFDVRATMLAAFDPAADPSGRAARAALALARILQEV